MTNVKKNVNDILSNSQLATHNIEYICGYPDSVEVFPLVCWFEDGQNELEFNDNKPNWNGCEVEVHIFTKKLNGYMTSNEIAFIVDEAMKGGDWRCFNNREIGDSDNEVEHRILNYRKEFLF